MTLYILDTDHLSLYGRNHPALIERLQVASVNLTDNPLVVQRRGGFGYTLAVNLVR